MKFVLLIKFSVVLGVFAAIELFILEKLSLENLFTDMLDLSLLGA